MSNDIIKDNFEFSRFVATEDDLLELTGEKISVTNADDGIVHNPPGAARDGTPLVPVVFRPADITAAPIETNHDKEIETDYKYIRDNLYTITETSVEALNNLSQIANQSQHPRAFEVLSLLVKTIADMQKGLMSIHKDRIKMESEKAKMSTFDKNPEVVNNNLFVGTTAQLDEIIKKMSKMKEK